MKHTIEVDSDKLKVVEDYANKQIDLTTYVKDLGFKVTGGVMSCPFHGSDSTPSLRINGNKWHCFGCGRGGGLLKFKHEYELLENHKTTYYQVAEDFQRKIKELTTSIDGTIFKTVEESLEEGWNRMLSIANENYGKPEICSIKSYDVLLRSVSKKPVDIKMRVLAGIQSGMPYKALKNIADGSDLTGMDLETLANLTMEE